MTSSSLPPSSSSSNPKAHHLYLVKGSLVSSGAGARLSAFQYIHCCYLVVWEGKLLYLPDLCSSVFFICKIIIKKIFISFLMKMK